MTNREKFHITVNSERDKDIAEIAVKFGKYLSENFEPHTDGTYYDSEGTYTTEDLFEWFLNCKV